MAASKQDIKGILKMTYPKPEADNPSISALVSLALKSSVEPSNQFGFFRLVGAARENLIGFIANEYLPELLFHIGHGNIDEAQEILKKFPELLVQPGVTTDIAGNYFPFITPLEYLLWSPDLGMRAMVVNCLRQHPLGDAIRKKCAPLLDAYQSEQGGVNYYFGGELYREKQFDFQPLISACEQYFTTCFVSTEDNRYTRRSMSRQDYGKSFLAIGKAQNRFPAAVRMQLCLLDAQTSNGEPKRTLAIEWEGIKKITIVHSNWIKRDVLWDNSVGVSEHSIVIRSGKRANFREPSYMYADVDRRCVKDSLDIIQSLYESNQQDLPAFIQQLREPELVPTACDSSVTQAGTQSFT